MPIYEYQCPGCGAILEKVEDFPGPKTITRRCSFCEEVRTYKKVMSVPAIVKVK